MSSIKETADLFFDTCEPGKGWEGCRHYCRAGVTFSVPDHRMKRIPSFLIAAAAVLIACWLLAFATPVLAQHGSPPAFWPEVSPDGSQVLFLSPSRSGPIYLMNADGSEPHWVAEGTRPSWFPDGGRIVAVARSGTVEKLVVMDADGSDPDTLPTAYPHYVWRPRVSPDGETIIVGNYWPTDFPNVFHIVRIDGTPVRDIHPGAPGELVEATWSHDGRLAFVAFSPDTASEWPVWTKLYVMNGDGSGERAVAMLPDAAQWISWSPDDREVALQDEGKDGDGNILVVDVTTGLVRRITHHDHPYLDETPSWSPDGWIYFQSNRTGGYAIYRMHADGSNQERLTH
jgi:Tol biopolymer transport system component